MTGGQQQSVREFRTSSGVYESVEVLGKGTYGCVYKVRSKSDPSVYKAIKVFVPETIDENEGVPSTTLREVNAVKTVNHPNVMTVEEVVIPPSSAVAEMFVVMELCRGTLKEKIQDMVKRHLGDDHKYCRPQPGVKLPSAYIQEAKLVAWQCLNAVAVCHSRGIMHRDLKPANILWSTDDLLKIGDFGLARFVRGNPITEDHLVPQTGEVQTMWYRAPEVLLGDERYGMLVDDWSLGCVVAELFRFRVSSAHRRVEPDPLFSGRGDIHTLFLIFEALGTPIDDEYLKELPFWSPCFPKWLPGNLRQKLRLLDDDGLDLVCKLLKISPRDRKACRFLLNHPWFNDVKDKIHKKYVPWYAGYEKEYLRLLEIDRMPEARPLDATGQPAAAKVETTTTSGASSSNISRETSQAQLQRRKRERSSSAKSRDQENRRPSQSHAATGAAAAAAATSGATKRNYSAGSRASAKSGQSKNGIQSFLKPK